MNRTSEARTLMNRMNSNIKGKEDLEIILSKLEELSFFNNFIEKNLQGSNRDVLLQLCSRMRMEYFPGGSVVFQEADVSNNKLYIVYYGGCITMRKKAMDQLQDSKPEHRKSIVEHNQSEQAKASEKSGVVSIRGILNVKRFTAQMANKQKQNQISDSEKQLLFEQYGCNIFSLYGGRGDGFGELALMNNTARSLTVAAETTDLYLVVLSKDDFQGIRKEFEFTLKEKQRLVFEIFRDVKDEYSSIRLQTMIYSFETINAEKGQVITTEEEKGSQFYIIQSGEIMLSRRNLELFQNELCQDSTAAKELFQSSRVAKWANISICIVGRSHLVGEEIVAHDSEYYDYTATVISQTAKLMVIDSSQFHTKFPKECKKQIIQDYKVKLINRSKLFVKAKYTDQNTHKQSNTEFDKSTLQLRTTPDSGKPASRLLFHPIKPEVLEPIKSPKFQSLFSINANEINNHVSPSAGQYCISEIVKTQAHFLRRSEPSLTVSEQIIIFKSKSVEPYDFGNDEIEEANQRNFIFQCHNRIIRNTPKYKEVSTQLFTDIIKGRFLKSMQKANRQKNKFFESFNTSTPIQKQIILQEPKRNILIDNSSQGSKAYDSARFIQLKDKISVIEREQSQRSQLQRGKARPKPARSYIFLQLQLGEVQDISEQYQHEFFLFSSLFPVKVLDLNNL